MIWDQFERIFLDKYLGEVAKHTKMMKFEHLIQGTATMVEYEFRFFVQIRRQEGFNMA